MEATGKAVERRAVLTKAVLRAADCLGLNRSELAGIIGLSPSTLSGMDAGEYLLDENSKHWELAALLVRLYRGLDAIMAGDEHALRAWMQHPNDDLHDVPAKLVGNVSGLTHVVAYVDAHRARI
ncbi:Protein of unknown function [Ectothiorhodospira mobilis]|uniref:Uncharacterized protein n=1 Tax=Ectothiorhodospira mobilis TaxID=195064 RepID=A0A1I4R5J7_ECTMO|nr:antitoxin Xre-like helix-turn-helix domain-containing protein [Ectothiorhodospira mobilis]SFM47246.1 Protein of unknown function [Ectothiorhodospira mobilis]